MLPWFEVYEDERLCVRKNIGNRGISRVNSYAQVDLQFVNFLLDFMKVVDLGIQGMRYLHCRGCLG